MFPDERRKEHNKRVLELVRAGDGLSSFDPMKSWFPPRPIIKKDKDALNFGVIHEKRDKDKTQRWLNLVYDNNGCSST